jgi:hypothetical protein
VSNFTRPYRPSCGSEGADFMAKFCDRCERDAAFQDGEGDSCPIAAATMAYNVWEPEYPHAWVEDDVLGPRCTAFVLAPGEDEGSIRDRRQAEMRV